MNSILLYKNLRLTHRRQFNTRNIKVQGGGYHALKNYTNSSQ